MASLIFSLTEKSELGRARPFRSVDERYMHMYQPQ